MSIRQLPEAWERHADKAAELEAKGDDHQWQAAAEYAEAAVTATQWQIAERVGCGQQHISRILIAWENRQLDAQGRVVGSFSQAYRRAKKSRNPWTARALEQWTGLDLTLLEGLIVSDIADVDVADGSLDAIVTDPPYSEEHLQTYALLARFAERTLKPGGHLLAMAGQSYLPDVLARLADSDLTYAWTLAYLTPGGQSVQLWDRQFNTFWKPVFFFTKGESERDWRGDVVRSDVNANEKEHHPWQQSESGTVRLVTDFTDPGDLVADPFLGGGTTAVCSLSMGRRFLGIDIDPQAVETTRRRIGA